MSCSAGKSTADKAYMVIAGGWRVVAAKTSSIFTTRPVTLDAPGPFCKI